MKVKLAMVLDVPMTVPQDEIANALDGMKRVYASMGATDIVVEAVGAG